MSETPGAQTAERALQFGGTILRHAQSEAARDVSPPRTTRSVIMEMGAAASREPETED